MTHGRPFLPVLASSTAAVALVLVAPLPAQAKVAPPQLSVAVDDGRSSTTGGDELSYTVTLTNLGTTTIKGLRLSQTVPPGAELRSSDPAGRTKPGLVSWQLDLPVGGTKAVSTSMAVAADTPETLLRLATVACARTSASGPPLVCAADSDQLPAGARAQARTEVAPAAEPVTRSSGFAVGGAAAVVVAGGLVGGWWWRRRRARPAG